MQPSPYFPNQTGAILHAERELRRHTNSLQETEIHRAYEAFSKTDPDLCSTDILLEEGSVLVTQAGGQKICFPRPVPQVVLAHIVFGYQTWLSRKYCLPGFVEVAPGDLVVDCGAYVGGFSLSAARLAAHLYAFEPEARNFACTSRNLVGFGNTTVTHAGLYAQSGTMRLNISPSSVEHSFLEPDDGAIEATAEVTTFALADFLAAQGVARLDFLKLEAEGVELEIFEGCQNLKPRKVAIDVSEEHNGESPAEAFKALLSDLGYSHQQRGHVLFARLGDEYDS